MKTLRLNSYSVLLGFLAVLPLLGLLLACERVPWRPFGRYVGCSTT